MKFINPVRFSSKSEVFGSSLSNVLSSAPKRSLFRAAIACVSPAGVKSIENSLKTFLRNNGTVEIIAGIDIGVNPVKGIQYLTSLCGTGSIFIFWNPRGSIFHPKLYYLSNANMTKGGFWVGSSNLSEGGLFKNYECCLQHNISDKNDPTLIVQIDDYFKLLRKSSSCQPATNDLIKLLLRGERGRKTKDRHPPSKYPLEVRKKFITRTGKAPKSGFVMLLSHNDVSGKRYEPYFLIPVRARDENPTFWGWPDSFSPSQKSGVPERKIKVIAYIEDKKYSEDRRIYWVEARTEYPFVSPSVYQLGEKYAGNILHITKTRQGYNLFVISPNDRRFSELVNYTVNLSSHQKKWGYIK